MEVTARFLWNYDKVARQPMQACKTAKQFPPGLLRTCTAKQHHKNVEFR